MVCRGDRNPRAAKSGLAKILDAAVGAGANRIHGIRFEVGEREKLLDEARRLAMTDAKRKAKVLAKACDLEPGLPVEISESSSGSPRHVLAQTAMAKSAGSVPIARGEQRLTTQVEVVFELRRAPSGESTDEAESPAGH